MSYRNPFPAAAVARLSDTGFDPVTIRTQAVQRALGAVDTYLEGDTGSGNVLAIVGEYGTGKTHLALEILRHISRATEGSVRHLYLDAPADTFFALYQQRFVVELSKADVRDRVGEYYADIVADSLADSELTAEAARRLRAREVAPQDVISRFGLMESAFVQQLQTRLHGVTENNAFGTALTLFLRPEFEDAVWEWLRGAPPDPVLAERGITSAIETDADALEAIGVFALLYGGQQRRFVLVVDELEKVLSPPHHPAAASILAFKKLLEVFSAARAFLVLSGLPDFLEALPEDAQQRIGSVVRPSALSLDDTRDYILDLQERAGDERTLAPFDDDALAYVVELAGGTARKIIKLCYHAYQAAAAAGTTVTRPMIREVAREQFELTSRDDVRAEIARVLDAGGWLFETDHVLDGAKAGKAGKVDFWVPQGDEGAGCAVLLSDSVLYAKQVSALVSRIRAIRRPSAARAVLIVVNGHLADNLAQRLAGTGDRPPLIYSTRRFADDFDAAVKGVMQRLEKSAHEDGLAALRDRVERLGRQQSRIVESIDELPRIIGGTLSEQQENLASLNAVIRGFARTAGRDQPDEEADPWMRANVQTVESVVHGDVNIGQIPAPVPPLVAREFSTVLDVLKRLDILSLEIWQSFREDDTRTLSRVEIDAAPHYSSEEFIALGIRAAVETATERFRDSVSAWLYRPQRRQSESGEDEPFSDASRLHALCEQYGSLVTGLRVHRLAALERRLRDRHTGYRTGDDFLELVHRLPTRVFQAVREEIGRPPRP